MRWLFPAKRGSRGRGGGGIAGRSRLLAGLFALAAAYTMGLARNHPFADGNKRVAFIAAFIFLSRNGYSLKLPEAETVIVMNRVAAGSLDEAELAELFRGASAPKQA